MAVGIGCTTTVFGVANALFLRSLPFPNGDRIVAVATVRGGVEGTGGSSLPDLDDWHERAQVFERVGAYNSGLVTILGDNPIRVSTALVRGEFFETLGTVPKYGRLLNESDMSEGAARVIVLHERLATSLFGEPASAIGTPLPLEDATYEVVGIIRDRERFPETADVWLPIRTPLNGARSNRFLHVVALPRLGVTVDGAQREMDGIARALESEFPMDNENVTVRVSSLRERYIGRGRLAFVLIAAAAVLVFAVSCFNIASLQLSRGVSRFRELAIRSALGAGRRRLVGQLLVESLILAILGSAAGVALAAASARVLAVAVAGSVPAWMSFSPDLRVAAFALIACVTAAIVFGLAPALRLTAVADRAQNALRTAGRGGLDRRSARLQRSLISAQLAVSIALLVGAALAARAVARVLKADHGFRAERSWTFRIGGRGERFATPQARQAFLTGLLEELQRVPGVSEVAATTQLPLRDCCTRSAVRIQGANAGGPDPVVLVTRVTGGYFRTLGIRLLAGREFAERDGENAPRVAIVSESFAQRHLGSAGADPIGSRLTLDDDEWTVVGIVADVRHATLTDPVEPQVYRPLAQHPSPSATIFVRSRPEATARRSYIADVRAAVRRAAPLSPPTGEASMSNVIDGAVAAQRLYRNLFVGFALAAGFLAVVGLYSMMAYQVAQRRTEIGVRAALGAAPADIRFLIVRTGLRVVAIGFALGGLAAFALARAISAVLGGVSAYDMVAYGVVAVVMIAGALLALLIPARRAASVLPTEAMRQA